MKKERKREKRRKKKEEKRGETFWQAGLFKSITMLMVGLLCPRLSNWWCNDSTSFPVLFVLVAVAGGGGGRRERPWSLGGQARGSGGVHWTKLAGKSWYLTRCCTTGGERRYDDIATAIWTRQRWTKKMFLLAWPRRSCS